MRRSPPSDLQIEEKQWVEVEVAAKDTRSTALALIVLARDKSLAESIYL